MFALTCEQLDAKDRCRGFVEKFITPLAEEHDQSQKISFALLNQIGTEGYLGALFPVEYGGQNIDQVTFGLFNEEFAKGCSSARSLLTVQNMVGLSLVRWGSEEQKKLWLPKLAKGEVIAAFALTEPNTGSDARNIEMTYEEVNGEYVLNGTKKWISFAQVAELFLVFARGSQKMTAFLVPKNTAGLTVEPIDGLLGIRGGMLAKIEFCNCHISAKNVVGKVGIGFSHIMQTALDCGRYSVAWGAVGIAQACLEACISYTKKRKQFESQIKDHQLIRRMVTEMAVNTEAARSLCLQAGYLKDKVDPNSLYYTILAKYYAAKVLNVIASDAVQIHGANGCGKDFPVQRYFRDAKIMEIIEGSNEILQNNIAQSTYRRFRGL